MQWKSPKIQSLPASEPEVVNSLLKRSENGQRFASEPNVVKFTTKQSENHFND